jgi:hypothetical protein
MKRLTQFRWIQVVVIATLILTAASHVLGDDKKKQDKQPKPDPKLNRVSRTPGAAEGFQIVEMFSAMEKGEVKVRIVPRNANEANLFVENTTDRPLSVEMPATFSAVPAMRLQMAGGGLAGPGMGMGGMGMGGQGGGMGGMGGMGGGQGFGGGMGGGMGGMGGMGGGGMGGMGGGMFNVPAGRKGKLRLNIICLEEGRPDPKPTMEYVVQPLEKLNNDPRIAEICLMLGNNEIATSVAQAAAWHITDNLSWQQLLVKNRRESMDGSFERFFHPMEIQFAGRVIVAAQERAQLRETLNKDKSGGEYYNSNAPTAGVSAPKSAN